jgi:mannose-6-phosphate isomerase-like protein (cupin superfamily)
MYIRDSKASTYFRAGDGTLLCELIHPDHPGSPVQLGMSLAQAVLRPGETSTPHRISGSVEMYYILAGEGVMTIDEEQSRVREGQLVYIPPGSVQSIKNSGFKDLVFLAIVSPEWRKENETVIRT